MHGTKVIDITGFAKDASAATPRTIFRFSQRQLENHQTTIPALIADPGAFESAQGEYAAVMTTDQSAMLLDYLKKGNFRTDPIDLSGEPEVFLGLSFGENPDVNEALAEKAATAAAQFANAEIYLQWELVRQLRQRGGVARGRIRQIDLDCDRDYITSPEVVDKFKRIFGAPAAPKAYLICQAWHAPRCLAICAAKQVVVIGGAFVDEFSPNDPQKWVRNWLAWVLKEGTK